MWLLSIAILYSCSAQKPLEGYLISYLQMEKYVYDELALFRCIMAAKTTMKETKVLSSNNKQLAHLNTGVYATYKGIPAACYME